MAGFNAHPQRKAWCGGDQDGTPDGPKLHSVLVDPRDPAHMYISMSSGGTFESIDGGADWHPLNQGVRADFQPNPDLEYGHDPHCVRFAGGNPDRLYQQNHCGIFRLDRPATRWARHRRRACRSRSATSAFRWSRIRTTPNTAWVFPMDGTDVWPRISPGGKPAAYRTRDGGKTWKRQADGMPKSQAWWTVKRQAMTADAFPDAGVYFGTTSGEVWGSRDEGRTLEVPRRAPAAHLRGRGGVARASRRCRTFRVAIPSPLRSYTTARPRVDGRRRAADPPTLARRVRGTRRRLSRASASAWSTKRASVRPHIQVFVDAAVRAQSRRRCCRPGPRS